jgi:hypothetical protein
MVVKRNFPCDSRNWTALGALKDLKTCHDANIDSIVPEKGLCTDKTVTVSVGKDGALALLSHQTVRLIDRFEDIFLFKQALL